MMRTSLTRLRELTRRRPWDGRDRVVVITGGAGGIGTALADRLAGRGPALVLLDRDETRLATAREALSRTRAASVETLTCDVRDTDAVAGVLAEVGRRHDRIDVLINNTGMTSAERFAERSVESMIEEVMLNTIAPLATTRLALPLLRRSADARVVTTVSLAGIWPQAETPLYCASKFGLRGAMLSIALDLAAEGIRVSSVLPSATDTRMLRQEAVDGGNPLQFQHPPQPPAEVAATVLSLLDRPRLEAYPRPGEARLVRAAMAFPNLVPVLLPLFEGSGRKGMERYLAELRRRGDIVQVAGRWEVR